MRLKIEEKRERRGCKQTANDVSNLKRDDSDIDDDPKDFIPYGDVGDNESLGHSSSSAYIDPTEGNDNNDDIVVIDPKDVACIFDEHNRNLYSVVNTNQMKLWKCSTTSMTRN